MTDLTAADPTVKTLPGFDKPYASPGAAALAWERSLMARQAGVLTPSVLGARGPRELTFQRITPVGLPSLAEMVEVLPTLHRMAAVGQVPGLGPFDPFLRIRPRLDAAPPAIAGLVARLEAGMEPTRATASVIHGDFHPGQVLRDGAGRIWVIDLDDLAFGPPEADLGNLAAWLATQTPGDLEAGAQAALGALHGLAPWADPALTEQFCRIALVRRGLKLAEKGKPWVLEQLALRA